MYKPTGKFHLNPLTCGFAETLLPGDPILENFELWARGGQKENSLHGGGCWTWAPFSRKFRM